jgi:hypothetical protein
MPDSWAEAANEVDFGFLEVEDPLPTVRWAGGFGYSHDGPASIEVFAQVEGHEVSVETSAAGQGVPEEFRRSVLLNDLVVRVFDLERDDLVLPFTLTLDAEERAISVDGESTIFEGYSADRARWAGIAVLPDGRQITVRASGRVSGLRLRRCVSWALPESKPQSR